MYSSVAGDVGVRSNSGNWGGVYAFGLANWHPWRNLSDLIFWVLVFPPGEGTPIHYPVRVCGAQRGSDFEAPDLERGIHFRGVF